MRNHFGGYNFQDDLKRINFHWKIDFWGQTKFQVNHHLNLSDMKCCSFFPIIKQFAVKNIKNIRFVFFKAHYLDLHPSC